MNKNDKEIQLSLRSVALYLKPTAVGLNSANRCGCGCNIWQIKCPSVDKKIHNDLSIANAKISQVFPEFKLF